MKLEKPYSIRDLATIDRVPDGTKRCRICQEVKNRTEFRTLKTTKGSWPYYACHTCSRELQRQAYLRKRSKSHERKNQKTTTAITTI
jgi:hypothetical protein